MSSSDSSDDASNDDSQRATAVPHQRKQRTRRERFVMRYSDRMALAIVFVPLIPLVFVLLHTGFRPGRAFCEENEANLTSSDEIIVGDTCDDRSDPWLPDVVIVSIGSILYIITLTLSGVILSASGSLMRAGVWKKITALLMSALVIVSAIQMAVPPFYRDSVLPLSVVFNYSADVRISGGTVQFFTAGLPQGRLAECAPNDKVMLEVFETSDERTLPDRFSPLTKRIYADDIPSAASANVSRSFMAEFEAGKFYSFLVSPAKEVGDDAVALSQTYDSCKFGSDYLIDFRRLAVCEWDGSACASCSRCA